jgi:predicted CDP-diglyceride synthetase/phosphatidate cytidylyltransferase
MEVNVQRPGRFSHLVLELSLGSAICFALALLTPLSVWSALGDVGSALVILGAATGVVTVAIKRNVGNSDSWSLPPPTVMNAVK